MKDKNRRLVSDEDSLTEEGDLNEENDEEEIMVQEYHISACVYHAGHTCNDQVTLSLAVEELKVPIMYLNPMTWCRRGITGGGGNYPMLTESGVKIMHSAEWFDAWLRRYG